MQHQKVKVHSRDGATVVSLYPVKEDTKIDVGKLLPNGPREEIRLGGETDWDKFEDFVGKILAAIKGRKKIIGTPAYANNVDGTLCPDDLGELQGKKSNFIQIMTFENKLVFQVLGCIRCRGASSLKSCKKISLVSRCPGFSLHPPEAYLLFTSRMHCWEVSTTYMRDMLRKIHCKKHCFCSLKYLCSLGMVWYNQPQSSTNCQGHPSKIWIHLSRG